MPLDPSDQGPGFAERTRQLQAGPAVQGPQPGVTSPEVEEDLRERRRRQIKTMLRGGLFAGQAQTGFGGS